MIIKEIRDSIKDIAEKYPIKKISLLGSYANRIEKENKLLYPLIED